MDRVVDVFSVRNEFIRDQSDKKQYGTNLYLYLKQTNVKEEQVDRLLLRQCLDEYEAEMTDRTDFEAIKAKAHIRLEKKIGPINYHVKEEEQAHESRMVDQYKGLQFDAFVRDGFYKCMMRDDFIHALAFVREKFN